MAFKKSLKGLLAGILVGAGALMPARSFAESLYVSDTSTDISIGNGDCILKHISGGQEGYDTRDGPWSSAPLPPQSTWLKSYSIPYGTELKTDSRALDSETRYFVSLSVYGGTISCSNQVRFFFQSSLSDSTRHYTAKIHCDTNYTPNNVAFDKTVNIRDVIAAGGYVGLPGITNVPNGTVYGTIEVNPQFNRLVSSKSGNGSNSFEGNVIMNYDSNTNVTLNADAGNCVDYYILTRTDNTGTVSVVTNDFIGTGITSTNIQINNIKGSNAIHAVYSPSSSGFSVNIENGTKYGLNPTNWTGVANGGSVTSTAANVYYYPTNQTGIRNKIVGLEKKL